MNNVGEQVIMFESVVRVYSVIVDSKSASSDAPLILSSRMCSELSREDIEDLLSHPPAFGECCECEVVGVYFPEAWNSTSSLEIHSNVSTSH